MTDETQGASPVEDAPVLPAEQAADSSPAPEAQPDAVPHDPQAAPRDEDGKFLSRKAQQRIDQLTWEKHQREREAEHWRRIAEQRPSSPEPKAEEARLPTLEAYGYDEAKYQAALLEYADARALQNVDRRFAEHEQRRTEQARLETFAARQREFAATAPDFEERVLRDPTLPISEAMRAVILDSETGPEIAYHLAQHREEAERIAQLPPHLAALALGRIEGRMQAAKDAKARPTHVTQTPPPPPKVEGTEPGIERDPETMPMADFMKMREKQIRKRSK